jgi:hypothetical protein
VCCGSSLFLKSKYGVGYSLVITRSDNEDSHKEKILGLVSTHLDKYDVVNDIGGEMFFRVGLSSSHLFPALFRKFDEEKLNLGIDSYGVSVTTLEEVFLKIGQTEVGNNEEEKAPAENEEYSEKKAYLKEQDSGAKSNESSSEIKEIMKKSGVKVNSNVFFDWMRHFFASFVKRYHVLKRDLSTLVCLILVPAVLMLAGVFAFRAITAQENQSLFLDLNQYKTPVPIPIAKTYPPSEFIDSFAGHLPSTSMSVLWDTNVFNSTSFVTQSRSIFYTGLENNGSERVLIRRKFLSEEILSKSTFWSNPSYGGFVDVANNGSFPFEFWIYLNQTGVHGKHELLFSFFKCFHF